MTQSGSLEGAPFYLCSSIGRLFALYFPPANKQVPKRGVLYFPPFAEEMNKARRMAALQARRLSRLGYAVLLVDAYGTGDSEGDFANARWETWRENFACAADWLSDRGVESIVLWGLRLGALLAMDLIAVNQRWPLERMLFWQPVVRGDAFMTQFLRLRVAADAMGKQDKCTVGQMRERLRRGAALEVAGYTLASDMLMSVDALNMETIPGAGLPPIDWIELAPEHGRQLSVAGQRLVDGWRAAGVRATGHVVSGEPFWTTPEIAVAPALLDKTCEILAVDAR